MIHTHTLRVVFHLEFSIMQTERIARATSLQLIFLVTSQRLLTKMCKQGGCSFL